MKSTLRTAYFIVMLLLCLSCRNDTPRFVIGVSQCSDDEWRNKLNQEILREAMFYDGLQVEIRTVKDDTEKQKEDIRYFIDKGVDLILVAPNEEAPMTPVVEEAFDKGIAVVMFDRNILSDKYTAFVGADNYEIGRSIGNYTVNLLNGKGNVLEITGLTGSTPASERHQGFMNAISASQGINLLCRIDAGWLRGQSEQKMDSILKIYPDIDLVYAHNDRMAAGAYQAALKAGRQEGMYFIGTDALPGEGYGLDLVQKGVLDATFIYPTAGDKMVQLAMNILEGRSYQRETTLNTAVVDPVNAHVMSLQTNQISELDQKIETLNERIELYLSRYATQQIVLYGSLLILVLVASLLLVVVISLRSKNRLNRELSEQKRQLEEQRDQLMELSRQLEEATHAKLVFFTNISHDFRTPLTLVADPLEHLSKDETLSGEGRKILGIAQKNVAILLRLVNQILDFRKYENGKLEFTLSTIDLLRAVGNWNESFMESARKKHIHFVFNRDEKADYQITGDVEKLERIYFNLLSNALKFTPENGTVTVGLFVAEEAPRRFVLQVSNTGSLIEPEHIQSIFDRFYKIDRHHAGSGIGLALVKAFVELHGGTIRVESDEKKGTVFTVEIPDRESDGAQIQSIPVASTVGQFSESLPTEAQIEEHYDSEKPLILIIDDNADIRTYIRELVQQEFAVLEAADGTEGIRKAMKYVPDVIVSDIMMPGIDGIECCRRLKSELQTCHIPIVLLTSCSLDEQRVQGYDGGADSYISKPFNSQVLLARLRNLISSARRIRQLVNDSQVIAREDVSDMDKEFVERFKEIIDRQMGDSDLNIEDIGKEMGLSRVQLYRKIKSLTNYAPNELIRITRLKKAASLLAGTEKSIAEICYEVGFTSPSYFTKCYREQYGESPTELLKRKKN